jgi:hypothetical protein
MLVTSRRPIQRFRRVFNIASIRHVPSRDVSVEPILRGEQRSHVGDFRDVPRADVTVCSSGTILIVEPKSYSNLQASVRVRLENYRRGDEIFCRDNEIFCRPYPYTAIVEKKSEKRMCMRYVWFGFDRAGNLLSE